MFFESLLFTEYELLNNKHVIDTNRIAIERKVLTSQDLSSSSVTEKILYTNKDFIVKKNQSSENEKFKMLLIKYLNPITSNLSTNQINILKSIKKDNLKQIKINTYCDDENVAKNRLSEIVLNLEPQLRKFVVLKHEICKTREKCNTTDIKLNY